MRPVAYAGFEDGYLSSIKVTWDNSEYGKGPSGTAIKTRKPSVMRDIATDPQYHPWRKEALKRGYTSSIALPLIYKAEEEEVIGVLNIYSDLKDVFGDEEVGFLTQVANDIAVGVRSFRLQKDRDRIFNYSMDKLAIAGFDGYFKTLNPSWQRTLGWTNEELLSKPYLEFVHRDDRESTVKTITGLLEGKPVLGFENRYLCKDGSYRWISWNSYPLVDEQLIFTVARDVTERKRLEEELKRYSERLEELVQERTRELRVSEARYRAVVEDQTELICRGSADWKITFVNGAYCRYFGKTREELIGHNVAPFILEEDREKVRNAYASLAPENPVVMYEQRVVLPSGEIRWQEWTDRAIYDEKGNMVEVQGVGRDITERRKLEEQLKNAQRMAAIGETAAMVGHDLRNPLQAIVYRLYLAEKATEALSSPYSEVAKKLGLEEMFKELGEHVKYMDKIVSDLQDYARPLQPTPARTSIHRLLDDTFLTIVVPANVKVSRRIQEDFPAFLVDAGLMRRVFANLITNAIQAMPDGGELIITASRSEDVVFISIQDTGVGISEENSEKIWSPLFTTKAKGTGLGLPTSRRLIEAHNGTITVESKVGSGSKFTIKLPLKREVN